MAGHSEKGANGHENHIEAARVDPVNLGEVYSDEEQRRIIRRIDRRLITSCGLAYFVSLMDRTNVGIAAIAGYDL